MTAISRWTGARTRLARVVLTLPSQRLVLLIENGGWRPPTNPKPVVSDGGTCRARAEAGPARRPPITMPPPRTGTRKTGSVRTTGDREPDDDYLGGGGSGGNNGGDDDDDDGGARPPVAFERRGRTWRRKIRNRNRGSRPRRAAGFRTDDGGRRRFRGARTRFRPLWINKPVVFVSIFATCLFRRHNYAARSNNNNIIIYRPFVRETRAPSLPPPPEPVRPLVRSSIVCWLHWCCWPETLPTPVGR